MIIRSLYPITPYTKLKKNTTYIFKIRIFENTIFRKIKNDVFEYVSPNSKNAFEFLSNIC